MKKSNRASSPPRSSSFSHLQFERDDSHSVGSRKKDTHVHGRSISSDRGAGGSGRPLSISSDRGVGGGGRPLSISSDRGAGGSGHDRSSRFEGGPSSIGTKRSSSPSDTRSKSHFKRSSSSSGRGSSHVIRRTNYDQLDIPPSAKKPDIAINCLIWFYIKTNQSFENFESDLDLCIKHIKQSTHGSDDNKERAVIQSINKEKSLHEIGRAFREVITEAVSNSKYTPLQYAIKFSFPNNELRALIGRRANIRIQDEDGMTAVHIAAQMLNPDALEVLNLIDPEAFKIEDKNGNNPALLLLREQCNILNETKSKELESKVVDCLRVILKTKIDPNLKNNKGKTLLYYACKARNTQIIELLLKHDALEFW